MSQPEPWMRGALPGVPPHVAPVFYCFQQVREDLPAWLEGLASESIWRPFGSVAPLGFHLRHIAGSVDRLTTYLVEGMLDDEQMAFLRAESEPGAGAEELLAGIEAAFAAAEERLRTVRPEALHEPRWIGRKRLPTTVLGLLVHVAEHTQRHLGQAIVTAKLARDAQAADNPR